jgi:amidase
VEFYRSLRSYLSSICENQKDILSLEDVVAHNVKHTDQEGGVLGTHAAWPTGQENFDRYLESNDEDDAIYSKALEYIRRESRARGI